MLYLRHCVFRILTIAANITHTYMSLNQIHGETIRAHGASRIYRNWDVKKVIQDNNVDNTDKRINELGIVPKVKLVLFQLGFYGSLA